jgi:hypothetical protein
MGRIIVTSSGVIITPRDIESGGMDALAVAIAITVHDTNTIDDEPDPSDEPE